VRSAVGFTAVFYGEHQDGIAEIVKADAVVADAKTQSGGSTSWKRLMGFGTSSSSIPLICSFVPTFPQAGISHNLSKIDGNGQL
jgi:hypothetical protein